jgi:hypothetical protein
MDTTQFLRMGEQNDDTGRIMSFLIPPQLQIKKRTTQFWMEEQNLYVDCRYSFVYKYFVDSVHGLVVSSTCTVTVVVE